MPSVSTPVGGEEEKIKHEPHVEKRQFFRGLMWAAFAAVWEKCWELCYMLGGTVLRIKAPPAWAARLPSAQKWITHIYIYHLFVSHAENWRLTCCLFISDEKSVCCTFRARSFIDTKYRALAFGANLNKWFVLSSLMWACCASWKRGKC